MRALDCRLYETGEPLTRREIAPLNILLFLAVVVIWGLTWFAIHLQVGGTPVDVAVFWRFALAVLLLGAGLIVMGKIRRPPGAAVPWLAIMGACLFSCNFLAIYRSETYLASGMVSVVFSMATILNTFNQWVFFRQRPDARVLCGGLLGVSGVALMLGGDIDGGTRTILGIGLALLGTTLFSLGNMVTRHLKRFDLDLLNTVFYAMTCGSLFMALSVLIDGHSFVPPLNAHWIGGLLYLSIFGTIGGFLFYLALAQRIGADKAAYTTILSPIIALAVSMVFEKAEWSLLMLGGLVLILLGNVLAFVRKKPVTQPLEVEQG